MRAAQIYEVGGIPAVGDAEEPSGDDVVDVLAASINPIDLAVSRGILATGHPPLPYVPGCEGVGRTADGKVVWVFGGGLGRAANGAMSGDAAASGSWFGQVGPKRASRSACDMSNGWLTIVTSLEFEWSMPFFCSAAKSSGSLPQHQTPTFLPCIFAIVLMPLERQVSSVMDSVPNGGWLDGCLNVLAGAEVLRRIAEEGTPPVTVRLVDWADEEGARFGRSLFGSSAAAGSMADQGELRKLTDRDGVALPEAVHAFGVDLDRALDARDQLENAAAYLELHIEQGPVLESLDLPLGVVLGTFGVERHRITWTGQAAHVVPGLLAHRCSRQRRSRRVAAWRLIARRTSDSRTSRAGPSPHATSSRTA